MLGKMFSGPINRNWSVVSISPACFTQGKSALFALKNLSVHHNSSLVDSRVYKSCPHCFIFEPRGVQTFSRYQTEQTKWNDRGARRNMIFLVCDGFQFDGSLIKPSRKKIYSIRFALHSGANPRDGNLVSTYRRPPIIHTPF